MTNPEKIRAQKKRYREKHKEYIAKWKHEWYKRNRTRVLEKRKVHYEINKEQIEAYKKEYHKQEYVKIRRAIRAKDEATAIKDCCKVCGSVNNLELHHFSYDTSGDYTILCHSCHVKQHEIKPRVKNG